MPHPPGRNRTRRAAAIAVAILAVTLTSILPAQQPAAGEWPTTGGDAGASRHSPLLQITPDNVARLQPAWTFDAVDSNLQVTPIVVGGLMYLTAGKRVIALEPETGTPVWHYDATTRASRRGVAYWPGTGTSGPRVFAGIDDGQLVALDARTGKLVDDFGASGRIDLKAGIRGAPGALMLDSPPAVYQDILITGGSNTEGEPSLGLYGDIRGWHARTGQLLWTFHTVPRAGEPGLDTWAGDSWKNRSGTNAWTYMTVDLDRGLVFAATGSPTSDFYGADRLGSNLYGNSLLALDATTGTLKWFQQLVHHDIWDWDLPAAPILIDVQRNGRTIPAVAQMTKMSTLFIFDRTTGEPLFGLEERAVPQSDVPGEVTSPTQPFPVQPPPLARTTFDRDTDLYALTPEHATYCRDLWDRNRMYTKGMFTPPGLDGTMVMFPSTLGGGNWSGLSYDAARGLLITNIMNLGQVARMERRAAPGEGRAAYWRTSPWGSAYGRFWNPQTKVPCSAPPFGELVAVDVNRAAVAWRVPLGVFDDLAARGFAATGTPNMGGSITTASGLVFVGASIDRRFRAFDGSSGRLLWETTLDASAHATPMTFLGRDGRQFVVVAAGGSGLLQSAPGHTVVAFALPAKSLLGAVARRLLATMNTR
ncbi:MAG: pyrroloquinoline quinone-dependent dehydrogenase [Vicinamibacterales bacterium]